MFYFQNKAVAIKKLIHLDKKALLSVVNVFMTKFTVKKKSIVMNVSLENVFDYEVHLLGFVLSVKVR